MSTATRRTTRSKRTAPSPAPSSTSNRAPGNSDKRRRVTPSPKSSNSTSKGFAGDAVKEHNNTPFPWAKVQHAYTNGGETDLVLKPGDEVEILGVDTASGFGYGQCGNRDGLFPLCVLEAPQQHGEQGSQYFAASMLATLKTSSVSNTNNATTTTTANSIAHHNAAAANTTTTTNNTNNNTNTTNNNNNNTATNSHNKSISDVIRNARRPNMMTKSHTSTHTNTHTNTHVKSHTNTHMNPRAGPDTNTNTNTYTNTNTKVTPPHPNKLAETNPNNVKALLEACSTGVMTAVKTLLQQTTYTIADIDAATRVCVPLGRLAILQLLFTKGARPNDVDRFGRTLFHVASENNRLAIMMWLISQGSTSIVEQVDTKGIGALHLAARCGHLEIASFLLRTSPSLVGKRCHLGKTALIYACEAGHLQVVETLLNTGAAINTRDGAVRSTVHAAATLSEPLLLRWLFDHPHASQYGLSVNAADKFGLTPIHIATAYRNCSVVRYLTSTLHADPMLKDVKGRTAVHVAVRHDCMSILEMLTSPTLISPEQLKSELTSLGVYAIKYNRHRAFVHLLKLGLDLNCGNTKKNKGVTMLHHCAAYNRLEILKTILNHSNGDDVLPLKIPNTAKHKHQLNINQTDAGGWSALHVASARGFTELVKLLLLHGHVDWSLCDTFGLAAFHMACRFGHLPTAKVLSCCGGCLSPTVLWGAVTRFVIRNKSKDTKNWVDLITTLTPLERCLYHGETSILRKNLFDNDHDLETMTARLFHVCQIDGSLASASATPLLMAALKPWGVSNHALFGPRHREVVTTMLLIGQRIKCANASVDPNKSSCRMVTRARRVCTIPDPLWLRILRYLPRTFTEVPPAI